MKDLSDVSFEQELIRLKLEGDPKAVAIYLRSHDWYPAQIADYLGVSRQSIYRWTDEDFADRVRLINRQSQQKRRKEGYVRPDQRK